MRLLQESRQNNISISEEKNYKNSNKMSDTVYNVAIKDFFQPQLNQNSAKSKVITASVARFIAKDLTALQCGWEWWHSRHGMVSNATFIEFIIL